MEAFVIELELPYPPSVNHYWRMWQGRMLIGRKGRAYRRRVGSILRGAGVRRLTGRLDVTVCLFPPDRRRRDLDNAMKGILDSMEHAGVYEDDSQIDRLDIHRCTILRGGKVTVFIKEGACQSDPTFSKPI